MIAIATTIINVRMPATMPIVVLKELLIVSMELRQKNQGRKEGRSMYACIHIYIHTYIHTYHY